MYDVDVHHALRHPWPKENWKEYVVICVKDHWYRKLVKEVAEKSSLKWLLVDDHGPTTGRVHPIWKATTRARLLVSRSHLNADRTRFDPGI